MKLKLFSFLLSFILIGICSATAQDNAGAVGPNSYGVSASMRVAPPLSSRTSLIPADVSARDIQDGRATRNQVVYGKGSEGPDYFAHNKNRLEGKIAGRTPSLSFATASSNSNPTDPSGAVGPNHYLAVFNTGFRVFDKSGNALTGQLSPDNIFSANGCCDLTISYDPNADDDPNDSNPPGRWVMSLLFSGSGPVEVAVSQTHDPVTPAWNVYNYPQIGDYQKLSVWSDGYYLTSNINSGSAGTSDVVFALERDEMIAGNPSAQIVAFPLPGIGTSGFYSPQAFNVSNDDMPAAGSAPIVYLQDDAWASVNDADHVKLWEIDVDWNTPGNSTISQPELLFTAQPFVSVFDGGSFSNLEQPGGGSDIDALQATVMNQAQFRRFGTHNSAVFNFVVDVDAPGGERAGIRWFELRQSGDGQPWSIYQEGTYTSPDGKNAWNASMIMDSQGNIGMGYTGMGGTTNTFVSSYYTGRFPSDDLGTMSVAETLIQEGDMDINSFRYSDYCRIDIDPSDDTTMWHVTELMSSGKKTWAGVFQIAPDTTNDVGVVSIDSPTSGTLTNAETVTVTVFNFGQAAASGFDVTFQVDGGTLETEAFPGTLNSQESAQFTFTATADLSVEGQTYSITAATALSGDENTSNDATTADVTHLAGTDVGVTAITAPTSGVGLSATETITVTIENFGGLSQSNIPVSYTIDGGTPVQETFAGPLGAGASASYSFTATADFSAFATYSVTASTDLSGDADSSNDATTVDIISSPANYCEPEAQFGCTQDGIKRFTLGTIDVDDGGNGCNSTGAVQGYVDRTNLITDLSIALGSNVHTMQAQHNRTNAGNTRLSMWIDFNNDGDFEDSGEQLIASSPFSPGNQLVDFVFSLPSNAPMGLRRMRVRSLYTLIPPNDANDPCANMGFGETHDYLVNLVDDTLSNLDFNLNETSLNVLYQGEDQFRVELNTPNFDEQLEFKLYNLLGQKLVYYRVEPDGAGKYTYDLDMSFAPAGVYIVNIGGIGKKIVVE